MMLIKSAAWTLAGLMAASGLGFAGPVNRRERHEAWRIHQGVASHELTAREAGRLTAEQALIRAEEYRYRHNDGHLGRWERADLRRDLNRASRDIYRQRHDDQVR